MKKDRKKILVIRFSSIGDIVICSPIIRCLKKQLDAEIHFLTKSKFAQINEHNPYVDKIWTIENDIEERIKDLKKEGFDLIVDLHKNFRSWRIKSGLKVRSITFDKINFEKWVRVYTRINLLPDKHLVDRYFEGLASIGIKNDGEGLDYFYPKSSLNVLDDMDLQEDSYVVIVLGANYYTKRVPQRLVKKVISSFDKKIVLIGGADVAELGHSLTDGKDQVVNLCGKISIHESAAIIDHASATVTGDTGMMHIAAALKTKIISIWGSTHKELGMYPYYGQLKNKNISIAVDHLKCRPCSKIGRDKCPLGHYKCLKLLDENRLMDAIYRHTRLIDKTI